MCDGVQSGLDLEKLMKRRECCKLDMKSGSKGMRSCLLSRNFGTMNALLGDDPLGGENK
jgi:hypothetical protein